MSNNNVVITTQLDTSGIQKELDQLKLKTLQFVLTLNNDQLKKIANQIESYQVPELLINLKSTGIENIKNEINELTSLISNIENVTIKADSLNLSSNTSHLSVLNNHLQTLHTQYNNLDTTVKSQGNIFVEQEQRRQNALSETSAKLSEISTKLSDSSNSTKTTAGIDQIIESYKKLVSDTKNLSDSFALPKNVGRLKCRQSANSRASFHRKENMPYHRKVTSGDYTRFKIRKLKLVCPDSR